MLNRVAMLNIVNIMQLLGQQVLRAGIYGIVLYKKCLAMAYSEYDNLISTSLIYVWFYNDLSLQSE